MINDTLGLKSKAKIQTEISVESVEDSPGLFQRNPIRFLTEHAEDCLSKGSLLS
jgi:hypothetical protein